MEPVKSNLSYTPITHEEPHPHTPAAKVAPSTQTKTQTSKAVEIDDYNEEARPGTLYFYQLPAKYKNLEYSEIDCKYLY